MKFTRKQLRKLIMEYTDFRPRDFRQADGIVFLEYLEQFIKEGSLNPAAEIDLIYPENAPPGKYYISLTQQELLERIPKLINQMNMSLGGEDAFSVEDNSGAFGTSPVRLKSYQRDDIFKQLTIYIPILLEDKLTFKHPQKSYEMSNNEFGLILYIMFDGSQSQIYLSEEVLSSPDIVVVDMLLDESLFDFAFDLLKATNDTEEIGQFIADAATQDNLPISSA